MIETIIGIMLGLIGIGGLLAGLSFWFNPWRHMKKTHVTIELQRGQSMTGVVLRRTRSMMYLTSVLLYDEKGTGLEVSGIYQVPRSQIVYVIGSKHG